MLLVDSTIINGFGAAEEGVIVKGATSQTANLQEWQDNAAAVLARVDKDGDVISTSPDYDDSQLLKVGHISQGGHSANSFPITPGADDAEFHNTEQADNNTMGTFAGGDFWEWVANKPSLGSGSEDIDTVASHLRVQTHKNDADAEIKADITLDGGSGFLATGLVSFTICLRWIFPISTTSDEFFEMRVTDVSSGDYLAIALRNDGATPAMQVETNFVDGGARTNHFTSTFGDSFGAAAIWLRWTQLASGPWRCFHSLDGITFHNAGNNKTFSATFEPDQLKFLFGKSDDAGQGILKYQIDSFRRG